MVAGLFKLRNNTAKRPSNGRHFCATYDVLLFITRTRPVFDARCLRSSAHHTNVYNAAPLLGWLFLQLTVSFNHPKRVTFCTLLAAKPYTT